MKDTLIDERKTWLRERKDKGRNNLFFNSENVALNEAIKYTAGAPSLTHNYNLLRFSPAILLSWLLPLVFPCSFQVFLMLLDDVAINGGGFGQTH